MNKYHVSFKYQTSAGNFGCATYTIEANDITESLRIGNDKLLKDSRRKVSRAVDGKSYPINPS